MNRLFNKVKLDGDCWEWIACKSIGGYGRILINGKARMAHRISYELLINKIPTGLTLNHECRNRACINPFHLFPMTLKDNILLGTSPSAIHAKQTHCKQGHKYSKSNTIIKKYGWRLCRTCNKNWGKKYYASLRQQ